MIDRGNMYRREPKVIRDSEGLLKVLSDRNGNEFNADSRDVGSELIVDYPPFARRIEVYVVGMNVQGKKEWRFVKVREWVFDGECSYSGNWVDVKR